MSQPSPAGGHHLLVDFWVADAGPLREASTWEALLPDACRAAGATVLGARFHQFEPEGVTGVVLLAESHASVHTWPEAGLVTLDVFTCGALDAAAIVAAVRRRLAPFRERVTAVARGDVHDSEGLQAQPSPWVGGDGGRGPAGAPPPAAAPSPDDLSTLAAPVVPSCPGLSRAEPKGGGLLP